MQNPNQPPQYQGQPGYPPQPGQPPMQQGYQPQYGQPMQPGYQPQYGVAPVPTKKKRPTAITVVCVIMILGLLLSILGYIAILAEASIYPGWFIPYLTLNLALAIASVVGLATMKKWGVIVYTVNFALYVVVALIVGASIISLSTIFPIIVIALGFAYFNQMD